MEEYENESCGWPGDGSGEDDLADYNANEADDYRNEGDGDSEENESEAGHDEPAMEDQHLDSYWESLTDIGD
jgi:hypothetical protein